MKNNKAAASMMGVWIAIGAAVGVATHHLALWLPIGVAIGLASTAAARGKLNGKQRS